MVRVLRNPLLKERHWAEMSQLVGINLTPNAGTTVARYMQLPALRKVMDRFVLNILMAILKLKKSY